MATRPVFVRNTHDDLILPVEVDLGSRLHTQIELQEESRSKEDGLSDAFGGYLRHTSIRNSSANNLSEKDSKLERPKSSLPIYVEFEEGDARNPANFSRKKKWIITAVACLFTFCITAASSAYNLGFPSMIKDLNCTHFEATIGLSLYAFGLGVAPLVFASFSEEFGRFPLYAVSGVGFVLMFLVITVVRDIRVVLVARFLQGSFGSTGATMVGGTIADIWSAKERGLPMTLFAMCGFSSAGLGPVFAGWTEMNPHLGWKYIQWIQFISGGIYLILLPITMEETRSSVLLMRIARRLRIETGDKRYRARVEDERPSLSSLIWVSCTRPVYLMLTEPVVISFSLWIGFAWGVLYCFIESIGTVFQSLYDFNYGQIGTVFVTMVIGCFLGLAVHFYQDTLYQKNVAKRGPEARLYAACFAAVLFPLGMFIFAFCSVPQIHWIALAIGLTIFMWGIFLIYVGVFSYLADCYGPFASSALAGQSLARNLSATAFPLFINQMHERLGFRMANILFASIAGLMMPIPFVLFFYGPSIRRRSKFSRKVMETEQQNLLS